MGELVAHGYNATLTLTETGVKIKPGVVGSLFGGGSFLSEKFIPYDSISGIEFKKGFPVIGEGNLQINTRGEVDEVEGRKSEGDAIDNNTIRFGALANKTFENIANEIRARVN